MDAARQVTRREGAVYGIITADMKVDDTELLAALKRERKMPPKDIPDEEKVKVANAIYEWAAGKQEGKVEE